MSTVAGASKAVKKRREYSPDEIGSALRVLAYFGGNTGRTSTETGIPQQTLSDWRLHKHRELYQEIAQREGPALEAIAATQARETILKAGEAEHDLLDLLSERIHEAETPEPKREDFDSDRRFEYAYEAWIRRGSTKELGEIAGAVQRVSTTKGINTTKLLELTGRPTQVVQHLNPRETMLGMARDLGITIDSTATEMPTEALTVESGGTNAHELGVEPPPAHPT